MEGAQPGRMARPHRPRREVRRVRLVVQKSAPCPREAKDRAFGSRGARQHELPDDCYRADQVCSHPQCREHRRLAGRRGRGNHLTERSPGSVRRPLDVRGDRLPAHCGIGHRPAPAIQDRLEHAVREPGVERRVLDPDRAVGSQGKIKTGQSVTPRPLERRVGRRTRKEWLLLFAFRSWLLTIRPYGPIAPR